VSQNSKTKLDAQATIPFQVMSESSKVECAVTAADDYSFDSSLEKRKKEAKKPLYLKRV